MKSEKKTHPSFGTIGVSRIQGSQRLFGSDVTHMHFIGLEIHEADVRHELNRDWIHGSRTVAEVWMSEAQFAQMITTPNTGTGVPCTIRHIQGDPQYEGVKYGRPLPPKPESYVAQFDKEAVDQIESVKNCAKNALDKLDAIIDGTAKANKTTLKDLRWQLEHLIQEVGVNADFILKSLRERMEKIVQTGITEFEAHITTSLAARGLDHLKATSPQLILPDTDTTEGA